MRQFLIFLAFLVSLYSVSARADSDNIIVKVDHRIDNFDEKSGYGKFRYLLDHPVILSQEFFEGLDINISKIGVYRHRTIDDNTQDILSRLSAKRIDELVLAKLLANTNYKIYTCNECGTVKVIIHNNKISQLKTISDNDRVAELASRLGFDAFLFWDVYKFDRDLVLSARLVAEDGRIIKYVNYEIINESYNPNLTEFFIGTFVLPVERTEERELVTDVVDYSLSFYSVGAKYQDINSSQFLTHGFSVEFLTNSDKEIFDYTGLGLEYQIGLRLDNLFLSEPILLPSFLTYFRVGLNVLSDSSSGSSGSVLSKILVGGGINYRFLEIYAIDLGFRLLQTTVEESFDKGHSYYREDKLGGMGFEFKLYRKF